MAGDSAEALLGGAATLAGGALVVSGAATCAASLPLAATGVGALLTAGACAAGAAEAAAGATVAAARIAAMVDGGSKLGHDLNRLERTGGPSGGGTAREGRVADAGEAADRIAEHAGHRSIPGVADEDLLGYLENGVPVGKAVTLVDNSNDPSGTVNLFIVP